ncbi:MAG: ATP-binding protein [Pseudomonadota bacterium]
MADKSKQAAALALARSARTETFADIASHDLREPLRGIAINAQFLREEPLSEAAQARVERMLTLTRRMEEMIDDLHTLSQLERVQATDDSVDSVAIIASIGEQLDGDVRVVGPLPHVRADRTSVTVLLKAVIQNGLLYNDAPQKLVEISFAREVDVDGRQVTNAFCVKDNGIGINELDREYIFRFFRRLPNSDTYGPGRGTGLAFSRKIVESHGGEMTFTSAQGDGTTFLFQLPLA